MLFSRKWTPLFILICLTSIFFFLNISSFEPDLNDEGLYFLNSFLVFNAIWSPLYSAYYWLMGLFFEDRLNIFHATFYLTSAVLFPTAAYLLSYRFFKEWTISALIVLIIFLSENNLGPITKIHIFNFSVLTLIYLSFYSYLSVFKMTVFFLLLGLSIHLRIENLILSIALLLSLFISPSSENKTKREYSPLYFFVFFCAFAIPKWEGKHPVFSDSKRSILAFIDHYIWTHAEIASDWTTFEKVYPKADTLLGFIISYPKDFFLHVWKNLQHIPSELSKTLIPYHSNLSPYLVLLLLFLIGSFIPRQNEKIKVMSSDLIFLSALILSSLILNTVMHPWGRYMVPMTFGTMIISVFAGHILANRYFFLFQRVQRKICLILVLFIYALACVQNKKEIPESNFSKVTKEWKSIEIREHEKIIFTNFLPIFVSSKNVPIVYLTLDVFSNLGNWKLYEEAGLFCHSELYDLPAYTGLTDVYSQFIKKNDQYGYKPYYKGKFIWCNRKDIIMPE